MFHIVKTVLFFVLVLFLAACSKGSDTSSTGSGGVNLTQEESQTLPSGARIHVVYDRSVTVGLPVRVKVRLRSPGSDPGQTKGTLHWGDNTDDRITDDHNVVVRHVYRSKGTYRFAIQIDGDVKVVVGTISVVPVGSVAPTVPVSPGGSGETDGLVNKPDSVSTSVDSSDPFSVGYDCVSDTGTTLTKFPVTVGIRLHGFNYYLPEHKTQATLATFCVNGDSRTSIDSVGDPFDLPLHAPELEAFLYLSVDPNNYVTGGCESYSVTLTPTLTPSSSAICTWGLPERVSE